MRYGARSDDTYGDNNLSRTFPRPVMENASSENHAAAAWVAGHMNAVQRQEFETHLANCAHCQEEVSALLAKALQPAKPTAPTKVEVQPPVAHGGRRRAVQIAIAAILTLIAGFAIGWSIWQMSHH
jgi:ferric-dicitrate binding protein FerR (iron transport regulator)